MTYAHPYPYAAIRNMILLLVLPLKSYDTVYG